MWSGSLQSVLRLRSLWPESFRGGCSFGTKVDDELPPRWFSRIRLYTLPIISFLFKLQCRYQVAFPTAGTAKSDSRQAPG